MRIAYLSADFGIPVLGTKGASVHVRRVVEALSELGHELLLVTANLGDGEPDRLPCRAVEVPLPETAAALCEALKREPPARDHPRLAKDLRNLLYAPWLEAEAAALLGSFAPDVIYERYSLFGTAGPGLARRFGVPLVLEVNAPLVLEQTEQRGLSLPETAQAAERRIFGGADHLIVVSRWLADHAAAQGVPPRRITVLPNAADEALFRPAPAPSPLRDRLGWREAFVVGFVGSMKSWHGVDTLVEAMSRLDARCRLLLVGDGPDRSTLVERARALGMADRVHFTGAVEHDEVPSWIAAMDVTVAPYAAGAAAYFSPVKLFEYMAMARPVIGARVGQTAELIDEGRTGWLYEPGDAAALARRLRWLAERPEAAADAGRAGRELVLEHHTWRRNAERIAGIAASLARQGGAESN